MKYTSKQLFHLSILLVIVACSSDDNVDKDEQKPTIGINYDEGFPQTCAQLVRGETYNFRATVTDNQSLASYSLDIHHNFDQHTHDDQDEKCDLEPKKEAVNPLIFMENYVIEDGLTSYEINIDIPIPNNADLGDYHCAYSVTDETGWQSRTSVDIKIIE